MSNNLIFVHGWASSPGVWLPIQNLLPESVVVTKIALPWCSNPTVSADFTNLEEYLEALDQKMPRSGIWIGWSLGGLLAIAYALRFPDKVKQLVLIGSAIKFVNDATWDHSINEQQFEQFYDQFKLNPRSALKWFIALQAQGDRQAAACRKLMAQCQPEPEKSSKTLLQGLDLLRNLDFRYSLQSMKTPVSCVHGECDQVIPVTAVRRTCKVHPAIQTHILSGCGHAPLVSQPRQVCDVFMPFL